jgi:hypothetical protein
MTLFEFFRSLFSLRGLVGANVALAETKNHRLKPAPLASA